MISKPVLKRLIKRYLKDAHVLLASRRYATAVYIGGYVMELALKYRICRVMKFGKGFPENDIEFNNYLRDPRRRLVLTTKRLKDIRHHDLQRLLLYSGKKFTIENNYTYDWNIVRAWQPANRYLHIIINKKKSADFIQSVLAILDQLV